MIKIKWGIAAGTIAFVLSLALGMFHGNNLVYVLTRALVFMAVFFGLGMGSWFLINSFIPELFYLDAGGNADSNEGGEGGFSRPGSRVNITLDSSKGFAMPEMYRNPDNPEEVGNIGDLISGVVNPASAAPTGAARASGGMDHNREDGYTYQGGGAASSGAGSQSEYAEFRGETSRNDDDDESVFKKGQNVAAVFSPDFGSGDGLGGLPDLDAMAGAFLTNAGMDADPMPMSAAPLPMVEAPDAAEQTVFSQPSAPERKSSANKAQPLKGDFNPKELAEGIRTVLSKEP